MTQPIREHAVLLICIHLASLASQSLANDPPPQPIGNLDDYRAYRAELERTQPADLPYEVRAVLQESRHICNARVAVAEGKWDEARAALAKLPSASRRIDETARIVVEVAAYEDANRAAKMIDHLTNADDRAAMTKAVAQIMEIDLDSAGLRTLLEPLDPADPARFAVMTMLFRALAREGDLDAARKLGEAESLRDVEEQIRQLNEEARAARDPDWIAQRLKVATDQRQAFDAIMREVVRLRRKGDDVGLLRLISKTHPDSSLATATRALVADMKWRRGDRDEAIALLRLVSADGIKMLFWSDLDLLATGWLALGEQEEAWRVVSLANGDASRDRLITMPDAKGKGAIVRALVAENRMPDAAKVVANMDGLERESLMRHLAHRKQQAVVWDNVPGDPEERWIIRTQLIDCMLCFTRARLPFE